MAQLELATLDLRLLSLLGRDPLRANRAMAATLGVSRETVARHLSYLREKGHLLGVCAQIRDSRVGLQTALCLMDCKPEDWPFLERVCRAHPYTHYRIRIVGPGNGLLALFAVPQGDVAMLVELFEALKEKGRIQRYDLHIPSANTVTSEMDFNKYSIGKGWVFDWPGWERGWEAEPAPLTPLSESMQHLLSLKDMRILSQISRDLMRPQGEIARAAGVSESHLSRRLGFYGSAGIVEGHRVLAGPFLTGIVNVVIFRCTASFEVVKKISSGVPRLPFQCTFLPDRNQFYFYAGIQPQDVPTVSAVLNRNCEKAEMLWGDYLSSYRWGLDPSPFVNGRWRADHDFMVNDVLKQVDDSKNSGH